MVVKRRDSLYSILNTEQTRPRSDIADKQADLESLYNLGGKSQTTERRPLVKHLNV